MVKLSGKLSFIKESGAATPRVKRVLESRLDHKHDREPLDHRASPLPSPVNSTSVKYSPLHLGPHYLFTRFLATLPITSYLPLTGLKRGRSYNVFVEVNRRVKCFND